MLASEFGHGTWKRIQLIHGIHCERKDVETLCIETFIV